MRYLYFHYPFQMLSKATIYKGILIALAFTLVPVSAISAVKITPGATCKVLNQKTVYSNKTYTCVKSGKKLVWNKGVAVATPKPSNSPTPTPTPTVQPIVYLVQWSICSEPSRWPEGWVIGMNANKSEYTFLSCTTSKNQDGSPTIIWQIPESAAKIDQITKLPIPGSGYIPPPTPAPTDKYPDAPTSFDDLIANYKGISYAAWSKASAAIIPASDISQPFKAVTGPNSTLIVKNPSTAFDLVARLYSGYKGANDFTILSFSYDDRDWAQEQMKQMQPNSTYGWITDFACPTRSTCLGGGVFTDDKGSALLVLTTEISNANQTSGTFHAHEYTHAIQQNQMRKTQPWPPTGAWPPTWYIEGQALFAQNAAIYYQSFDLYTKNRMYEAAGLFKDSTITSQWIQDFFVVSQTSSWFSKYDRWRMYDLGAMLVEILTALKGPSSTMELWKLSGTGLKFTEAFEKVYGISFEKALPIISKAIALELGRS